MTLEALVDSLLYEGYALYPYTPGATKNATPTPFGIVYPPAYAAGSATTFHHLRLECLLVGAGPEPEVRAEIRFLQSCGERHEAVERRVEATREGGRFAFEGGVEGRARLRVDALEDGRARVRVCVHNESAMAAGADRAQALRRALLSTHVIVSTCSGRFASPLASGCESVNTYPVLASPDDRTVVGAAIVLPDHPQLAPESGGSLFDSTEIEEALLLHVHALSDGEREAIAMQDPAVREMVARAAATTPEDIIALHGRVTISDPPGEREAVVDGVTFRLGARVVLRPGAAGDPYDRMLHGRTAIVERILVDYDGGVHLGVTVEGDPAHELLGETGRYLFFRPGEVEVMAT